MQITHIGHSCMLVEAAGARLLIDPGTLSHGFEELTDLDGILVTHQHIDHLDSERLPALLEANDGTLLAAEPETAAELRKVGIEAAPLHAGDVLPIGDLTVAAVGGRHAVIHEDIPRIGNVGLVVRAEGEPTLYHPGDAIDTVPGDDVAPGGVDVLGLPLAAPWSALKETVEFLRAVSPGTWFPIHDALLSPPGRGVFLRVGSGLAPETAKLRDLAGAGPSAF